MSPCAVAFVGQDDDGDWGTFVQDFVAGRDTSSTRRRLAAFETETAAESFGISPDGGAPRFPAVSKQLVDPSNPNLSGPRT